MDALKEQVYQANQELVRKGLVLLTWGNASAIDRQAGVVAIKPSGIPYDQLTPEKIVIVDMDGQVCEGHAKPSVDLPVHLALYHAFEVIGGIVHTHSRYATSFAQACRPIPCLGTTHADYFHGEIPLADILTQEEVSEAYESHIGEVIIRAIGARKALDMPGILAANHGPFTWGKDVAHAVENAVVLEEIAHMAWLTLSLTPGQPPLPSYLLDKHFLRKHGDSAYYGQLEQGGE